MKVVPIFNNDKKAPIRKPPTICNKFLYFQFFVNSISFFICNYFIIKNLILVIKFPN